MPQAGPESVPTRQRHPGAAPNHCLFLDDDPSYVAAAIALGYQGLVVPRQPNQNAHGVPAIRSIDAILDRPVDIYLIPDLGPAAAG